MEAKIINLSKIQQRKRQEAYEWANKEFEAHWEPQESVRLELEPDEAAYGRNGCIPSLFCDHDTGRTLYRGDWLEQGAICYYVVGNLEELCSKYSDDRIKRMLENGIKIHEYFTNPKASAPRLFV